MFARGLDQGVLLRPIGHTLYFMPPYVTGDSEFAQLVDTSISLLDALA
ncbi:MAG: hypothetical protein JNJ55_06270 [Betaproteobacteria bacterium]|nr:hypothetical protein [Betaproteobacteria bacterium]